MMSPEEFAQHREVMRGLEGDELRQYREAHRESMRARAAEQGFTLPEGRGQWMDQPPRGMGRGLGPQMERGTPPRMGRGMGPGAHPGMGAGRGYGPGYGPGYDPGAGPGPGPYWAR
ncbi:hypothetical protein THITH_08910 [Thioalkalivibrio paradoxus ARh 1]|uniref:Uncharacterized protein n=1 Tax=Thioalkalivibrio paradoxus ARh 1 TaxID=713585 RepID=W0DNA1_9GAMM|nr:hypothetical protein THITH_08910 [Thioalkalivibrio paradoxus ARh 1]